MDLIYEYGRLARSLSELNSRTRHANLRICAGMYYDHIAEPLRECYQCPADLNFDSDQWDYVRYRTLELVAESINNNGIEGAMAEAGVYQGDFASAMHALLPERILYLFDTFEGFTQAKTAQELKTKRISSEFAELAMSFDDTNEDLVLSKMADPSKCVICKGDFAETSRFIDSLFCLVSVDMDYYQPTREALEFFYPRLVKGGCILVHDYNHDEIRGVREAVESFRASNPSLITMPLADQCGTLAIMK